ACEVDPGALLEEEAARKPAKRRLARDVLVVGADQVACHGPGADEAVEAPQRGGWLWGSLVAGHDGSLLCVLVRPFRLGRGPGVAVSSPCVREGSSWGDKPVWGLLAGGPVRRGRLRPALALRSPEPGRRRWRCDLGSGWPAVARARNAAPARPDELDGLLGLGDSDCLGGGDWLPGGLSLRAGAHRAEQDRGAHRAAGPQPRAPPRAHLPPRGEPGPGPAPHRPPPLPPPPA